MDNAQIVGYLVVGIITLGSFFGVVSKFTKPIKEIEDKFTKGIKDIEDKFTKSINDLTLVMRDLKNAIDNLKESNNLVNKRLETHDDKINGLDKRVQDLEVKMSMYHKGE